MCLCVSVQRFQELDGNAKKFTLPLFGQLGRASSAHQVGRTHRQVLSASFSNPASVQDLSISPPVSPSKPPLMPQLSRRQRRASMVSRATHTLSLSLNLSYTQTHTLYLPLSSISLTHTHTHYSLNWGMGKCKPTQNWTSLER